MTVPRQLCPRTTTINPYVHIFCDSSEEAYSVCVYLGYEHNPKADTAEETNVSPTRVMRCANVVELKTKLITAL